MAYIAGRLAQAAATLLLVLVIVFVLARATGDPAQLMLPTHATQEEIQHMRHLLGTDRPLPIQFGTFLRRAMLGDLGTSVRLGEPVTKLLGERLPNSLKLAAVSMSVAILIALLLGTLAAVWRNSPLDVVVRLLGSLGQSMPSFWLAVVLIEVFAVGLKVLPVAGNGGFAHYLLPATVIGWVAVSSMMRLLRAQLIDVLAADYIRTAKSKGLRPRIVVVRHALRNAILPVVTYAGLHFAILLGGVVVVETVFAWPGIGQLGYQAIQFRDFPLIQGVTLLVGAMIVVANLCVDLLYGVIDPRIRVNSA